MVRPKAKFYFASSILSFESAGIETSDGLSFIGEVFFVTCLRCAVSLRSTRLGWQHFFVGPAIIGRLQRSPQPTKSAQLNASRYMD
jgi:hypothetical protein